MSQDDEYRTLLELFVRLVESQAGKRIPPGEAWMNDAQTLAIKLFRHLSSMQSLALGATLDQGGGAKGAFHRSRFHKSRRTCGA